MSSKNRRTLVNGAFLVALGVYFLLLNLRLIPGDFFLAFLGIGFLLVYFLGSKNPGFLIPGLIILAIFSHEQWGRKVAILLDGRVKDGTFFIFLGLAFLLIYIIHYFPRGKAARNKEGYWPLYPGIGLLGFGLVILYDLFSRIPWKIFHILHNWWPLILIIIGLGIIIRTGKPAGKK